MSTFEYPYMRYLMEEFQPTPIMPQLTPQMYRDTVADLRAAAQGIKPRVPPELRAMMADYQVVRPALLAPAALPLPSPDFYPTAITLEPGNLTQWQGYAPVRQVWHTIADTAFQTDPFFQPIYNELSQWSVGLESWSEFKTSADFGPSMDILAIKGADQLRRSKGFLSKAAEKGWRWIKKVKPTPTGIALWFVQNVGWEVGTEAAQWAWNKIKDFDGWDRTHRPPAWFTNPDQWRTGGDSGGPQGYRFRPLPPRERLESEAEGAGLAAVGEIQVAGLELVTEVDPPFLVAEGTADGDILLSATGGLYR